MIDNYNRKIDYVRISITDRCNQRCIYCMPEEGIEMLECNDILSYEQIITICKSLANLGIKHIKITGGEPLVRKNVSTLISGIKNIDGIETVTLTTNGILLAEQAQDLKDAGIDAVNISLDTLNEELFQKITRRKGVDRVLAGIDAAIEVGIPSIKVNCVPIGEINDSDIFEIIELCKNKKLSIRFIEIMPIGCGQNFVPVPQDILISKISNKFGKLTPYDKKVGNGPAKYFSIDGFDGTIGFISAVSHEFCSDCNRIRITANGFLKTCLFYDDGINLKDILDRGEEYKLTDAINQIVFKKPQGHKFSDLKNVTNADNRKMSQIGG